MRFILASSSPRRSLLLKEAGFNPDIIPADIPEEHIAGETPAQFTERLALEKADCVAVKYPDALVLGSDTVVVLDEHIIGKPQNREDALQMLQRMSGRSHQVVTGVALLCKSGNFVKKWHCTSNVNLKSLNLAEIEEYHKLVNPLDKAGSYSANEHEEIILDSIDGLKSNVIGLPVEEVTIELNRFFKVKN